MGVWLNMDRSAVAGRPAGRGLAGVLIHAPFGYVREMGRYANASRHEINVGFEGTSGDLRDDGAEPIWIESRKNRKSVIAGEVWYRKHLLEIRYQILDPAIDDDDARRLLVIAYLGVFTGHYWYGENHGKASMLKLELKNTDSGASTTIPYPDPE